MYSSHGTLVSEDWAVVYPAISDRIVKSTSIGVANLFGPIDHLLHDSLYPLKLGTHVLTGAHRGDGIGQGCGFIRIREVSISDSILPLLFSILLEL